MTADRWLTVVIYAVGLVLAGLLLYGWWTWLRRGADERAPSVEVFYCRSCALQTHFPTARSPQTPPPREQDRCGPAG